MPTSKMSAQRDLEHEEGLVRGFIVPRKQERWLSFLGKPKRRGDVLNALAHFEDIDERYAVQVPADQQSTAEILATLLSRGAPNDCYLIAENLELDQRKMLLTDALHAIFGAGWGVLVSCVPGRLGYFEGEKPGQRFILERRPT